MVKWNIKINRVIIITFIAGLLVGLGAGLITSINMTRSANEMVKRFSVLAGKALYMTDIVRVTDVAYIIPVAVFASYNTLKANAITNLGVEPEIYLERPIDLVNITLNSLKEVKPPNEVEDFHKILTNKFSILLSKLVEYREDLKKGNLRPLEALKRYREIVNLCNEILELANATTNTLRKTI